MNISRNNNQWISNHGGKVCSEKVCAINVDGTIHYVGGMFSFTIVWGMHSNSVNKKCFSSD